MIVQISVVANGKFVLLALDDGSGENIEVKIERRQIKPVHGSNDHHVNNLGGVSQIGATTSVTYSSVTLVDNLIIQSSNSSETITIGDKLASIGTIIQAGGTVITFMDSRQLMLEMVCLVKDTNEEASYWSKLAAWKRTVLAKPWILTDRQREDHDAKLQQDSLKAEDKSRKRREHERKAEKQRKRLESEMNRGALPGSDHLRRPWEDYFIHQRS
jgi:hypothetical protein